MVRELKEGPWEEVRSDLRDGDDYTPLCRGDGNMAILLRATRKSQSVTPGNIRTCKSQYRGGGERGSLGLTDWLCHLTEFVDLHTGEENLFHKTG